ncbi:2OG-Fe(II) oxygenase [Paucibacter sp. APW11]|uniref:2OG-Fe(II) oxygenase n=1 Tax=Roseateles aquae TaxID=3077235 RepID=A0ABU3PB67_9BURK|nr:2OG-Fe(II) oxygenase [Paucibacter sp. APW11]MDT8998996.1 2OG-Fe(II) oxygenase [Paucibacter sp. APW11]
MSEQNITPELRRWLQEQQRAGVAPEQVLKAMQSSGWTPDVALQALAGVFNAEALAPLRIAAAPAAPVPEPALQGAPTSLWAHDREVKVLLSMAAPRLVVFGGLLSDEECVALRESAATRLARSETVAVDADGSEINTARTSRGMFFDRGETELCCRIEARIAALLNWPIENGEGLQVLHYQPGAEYLPHYDYFEPNNASSAAILQRGGNRVGTLVMYLNTPLRGGGTIFPNIKLEVAPVQGNAVFFSYDRPHPSTLTLHGGTPVLEGEKWVATKWMRQGVFE